MADYEWDAPWFNYSSDIKSVVIEDGVTPDYIIKPKSGASYINDATGFINTVFSSVKFSDDSVVSAGDGSYIVGIAPDGKVVPNTEKFDFVSVLKD